MCKQTSNRSRKLAGHAIEQQYTYAETFSDTCRLQVPCGPNSRSRPDGQEGILWNRAEQTCVRNGRTIDRRRGIVLDT